MNSDIRLKTSFRDHRKRKKLHAKLGAEGVLAFIDLMLMAAETRPDGVLTDMDKTDVALDANWQGSHEELVSTLIEVRLLDVLEDGTYAIHDWQDHNAYAAAAEKRSEAARNAALARWGKRCGQGGNADLCDSQCENDAPRMPIASKGNAPSPTPSPTQEEREDSLRSSSCDELCDKRTDSPPDDSPADDPVFVTFPTAGKPKTWDCKQSDLDRWKELFPDLDVERQIRLALAWVEDNPGKKKTANGMKKYITSWLTRAQNRGDGARASPAYQQPKGHGGMSYEEAEKRGLL